MIPRLWLVFRDSYGCNPIPRIRLRQEHPGCRSMSRHGYRVKADSPELDGSRPETLQVVPESGIRFRHAGRILNLQIPEFGSEDGEAHGHSVIVMSLDRDD